jgi:hypothetical protein
LVIRAAPALDLALKKKQPPSIEKKMMEEFEKMGKQGAGIEELLKQLLDEVVSNCFSMAQMEESMHELKMVADGNMQQIEAVQKKVETPPLPPPPLLVSSYPLPSGKVGTGRSPLTTEKLLDLAAFGNNLRVEMRNQGNGEGILGIPPRPPESSVSHSAPATPTFCSDPLLGKYFESLDHTQSIPTYLVHKHFPKLDFPKFNGGNPKIWPKM